MPFSGPEEQAANPQTTLSLVEQLHAVNLHEFDRPALPAVYTHYQAFMETGDFPYLSSVFAFIQEREPSLQGLRYRDTTNPDFKNSLSRALEHEIFLASRQYRLTEMDAQIAGLRAEGYEPITTADLGTSPRRFAGVVHYGFYSGGTGLQTWAGARLFVRPNGHLPTVALLAKGKRTHGVLLHGKVLVKR